MRDYHIYTSPQRDIIVHRRLLFITLNIWVFHSIEIYIFLSENNPKIIIFGTWVIRRYILQ